MTRHSAPLPSVLAGMAPACHDCLHLSLSATETLPLLITVQVCRFPWMVNCSCLPHLLSVSITISHPRRSHRQLICWNFRTGSVRPVVAPICRAFHVPMVHTLLAWCFSRVRCMACERSCGRFLFCRLHLCARAPQKAGRGMRRLLCVVDGCRVCIFFRVSLPAVL